MKQQIWLLLIGLLIIPISAKAEVDANNPQAGHVATLAECTSAVALNDDAANKSATTGYYVTCLEMACENDRVVLKKDHKPFVDNVICSSGNKNPRVDITTGNNRALDEGAACSKTEQEGYFGNEREYVIVKYNYFCAENKDKTPYVGTNTNNTSNTNTNNDIESPATGINTYYLVLSSIVLVLGSGLYIVNKKNLFKKI